MKQPAMTTTTQQQQQQQQQPNNNNKALKPPSRPRPRGGLWFAPPNVQTSK